MVLPDIQHDAESTRLDVARDETPREVLPEPAATCPLCHTIDVTMSDDVLASGGWWRCTRCGQAWDAERLSVVAAYVHSETNRRLRTKDAVCG
jgi:predicted Zn finger-like uncharacterized protein